MREAYETVSLQYAPPVTNGTSLLQQIEQDIRFLNFGCLSIDKLLEGGAREGQVLELYGESGEQAQHNPNGNTPIFPQVLLLMLMLQISSKPQVFHP